MQNTRINRRLYPAIILFSILLTPGVKSSAQQPLKSKKGIKFYFITDTVIRIPESMQSGIENQNSSSSKLVKLDRKYSAFNEMSKAIQSNAVDSAQLPEGIKYDVRKLKPKFFYSYADRVFAGVSYEMTRHAVNKESWLSNHSFDVRYSISQQAMSFIYEGDVREFVGKWNLDIDANYDQVRWTNFFGMGNETVRDETADPDYYRMRTEEIFASMGLNRRIGKYLTLELAPQYQMVKIIADEGRLISTEVTHIESPFTSKHFVGGQVGITYENIDDEVVTRKGLVFSAGVDHLRNIKGGESDVTHYNSAIRLYVPVLRNLIAAVRVGGATLSGNPEFYQYNSVGGSQQLRGFNRDRFRGNSSFYNSNELQWLFNIRFKKHASTVGLVGLYDIGRVWLDGQQSDTWHKAYGGGIMIAPLNKVMVSITCGVSTDGPRYHLRYASKL